MLNYDAIIIVMDSFAINEGKLLKNIFINTGFYTKKNIKTCFYSKYLT